MFSFSSENRSGVNESSNMFNSNLNAGDAEEFHFCSDLPLIPHLPSLRSNSASTHPPVDLSAPNCAARQYLRRPRRRELTCRRRAALPRVGGTSGAQPCAAPRHHRAASDDRSPPHSVGRHRRRKVDADPRQLTSRTPSDAALQLQQAQTRPGNIFRES